MAKNWVIVQKWKLLNFGICRASFGQPPTHWPSPHIVENENSKADDLLKGWLSPDISVQCPIKWHLKHYSKHHVLVRCTKGSGMNIKPAYQPTFQKEKLSAKRKLQVSSFGFQDLIDPYSLVSQMFARQLGESLCQLWVWLRKVNTPFPSSRDAGYPEESTGGEIGISSFCSDLPCSHCGWAPDCFPTHCFWASALTRIQQASSERGMSPVGHKHRCVIHSQQCWLGPSTL